MKPKNFRIIFYSIVGIIAIFLSSVIFVSVKYLKEEQRALLLKMHALDADEIDSIEIRDDAIKPNVYYVNDADNISHFVELANGAKQLFFTKGRRHEEFLITIFFKSGSAMSLNCTLRDRETLFVNDENVGYEVMLSNIGPWFSKQIKFKR